MFTPDFRYGSGLEARSMDSIRASWLLLLLDMQFLPNPCAYRHAKTGLLAGSPVGVEVISPGTPCPESCGYPADPEPVLTQQGLLPHCPCRLFLRNLTFLTHLCKGVMGGASAHLWERLSGGRCPRL